MSDELNSEIPSTERPPLVRSNSINVASVFRSREADEEEEKQPIRCPSANEPNHTTTIIRKTHRRRRSLNVASLFRSPHKLNFVGNSTTCIVDNATIQQHINVKMPPNSSVRTTSSTLDMEDEEMGLGSVPGTTDENKVLPDVQFNVPSPCDDIDIDSWDETVAPIRQRPVTFGAYQEDHNNEMIPELVHAEGIMDSSDEETTLDKEHWIISRIRTHIAKATPLAQLVFTVAACVLTFCVIHRPQPGLDAQIATMVLVTLCGSTFPHLITATACGVYAGSVSFDTVGGSYAWVLLLGAVTAVTWQLVSKFGLMLGFSGRLGASAFVAMNITALFIFSIDSNISFDRYGSLDQLWNETLQLEEALVGVAASVFLAASGGYLRLSSTIPVNPVLVPSAWALFCMLLTSITEYRFTSSVLQAYSVGAYVAMASEARVPTTMRFALIGMIAGLWNIFLAPFFLGFGGKAGFTAMLGYSTYLLSKKIYKKHIKKFRNARASKR